MRINQHSFYKQFSAMEECRKIRPEIRPYSSRHSNATEVELLGVSPSVIAQVLCHKTYATTAKHYIAISTDKAHEVVNPIAMSFHDKS